MTVTYRTYQTALLIWDHDKEDWTFASARACVARWKSTNAIHLVGSICGEPGVQEIGDAWFCQHHYNRAETWRSKAPEPDYAADAAERRAWEREHVQDEREHRRELEERRRSIYLVYYIRRVSDGRVKIGTTGSIGNRLSTLRGQHGALQVLLTHSGGRDEEARLHGVFDAWRLGRTEWFNLGRPLAQHILRLRRAQEIRTTQLRGTLGIGELREICKGAPAEPTPLPYLPPKQRAS